MTLEESSWFLTSIHEFKNDELLKSIKDIFEMFLCLGVIAYKWACFSQSRKKFGMRFIQG